MIERKFDTLPFKKICILLLILETICFVIIFFLLPQVSFHLSPSTELLPNTKIGNCDTLDIDRQGYCLIENGLNGYKRGKDQLNLHTSVVFIGDSHMAVLTPNLVQALKSYHFHRNWQFLTFSGRGCLFVMSRALSKSCLERNSSIENWVSKNKNFIILVSHRDLTFYAEAMGVSEDLLLQQTIEALEKLLKYADAVFYLTPNPVFSYPDSLIGVIKRVIENEGMIGPKLDSQSFFSTQHFHKKLLALNRMNLIVESGSTIVCEEYSCSPKQRGIWYYHDDDHLNEFGARKQAERLAKLILSNYTLELEGNVKN